MCRRKSHSISSGAFARFRPIDFNAWTTSRPRWRRSGRSRLRLHRRSAPRAPHKRPRFLWLTIVAFAFIGVVAAAALWYVRRSPPDPILTPIPLTTYPGFESSPTFSPDGEQVAFSWCKHEATPLWQLEYPNICNIYIKQIGVEPPSRLTEATAKEFSPAWSPDGKWIAFLRMVSATRLALVLIPQRGGREKVLQEHDLTESSEMPPGPYLAWTPDSRWLVCTTPGHKGWFLSLVAVDSEDKHILTKPSSADWGDTAPAISPDGRVLAFSRYEGGYDLYVLRLSAQYAPQGEPLKLRSEHPPNFGAAWLPDGRGILFASGWRGENGLWRTSMASGATPQRLPFAPTFATDPALSRRGNRLAYTAYRSDTNIWGVELAGPSRRPAAPAPIISSTKHDYAPAIFTGRQEGRLYLRTLWHSGSVAVRSRRVEPAATQFDRRHVDRCPPMVTRWA